MYNRERYEWLLDKAQKELPDIEVVMEIEDLGHQLWFAFRKGKKMTAYRMWNIIPRAGDEVKANNDKEYQTTAIETIISKVKVYFD